LQQAKLSYLKTASPEKMHPRYWGAFVLSGNTSPIVNQKNMDWIWWMMGMLIVIFGVFGIRTYLFKK